MRPPTRVLHLVDSMNLGGIQTLLRDVLPALAASGIEMRLAALHGPGPFTEVLSARGITPTHLARSKFNPAIMPRLGRLLRNEPVDILHCHGVPSCWLGQRAYASGRVPHLIQHLHHMFGGQHGQRLQGLVEKTVYRRGDRIICCSEAVAESVPHRVNTCVLYNGVDTTHFRPPTLEERQSARAHFHIKADEQLFCMTGRITRQKGVMQVCKALAILVPLFPKARMIVAGVGPDSNAVQAYCNTVGLADRVIFAGFQHDIRRCLYAADAYIMASTVEGLGMSLLEAMATGLPAVVANYTAAREIVHDGINAYLYDHHDTDALTSILRRIAADIKGNRFIGSRACKDVAARFALENTVKNLGQLYDELLVAR